MTSEKGKNALLSVNKKIDYLGNLIDNLFSITLLTGKKYPFHPQSVEMNRFVRSVAAHWYAVFEQEGFDMQVETLEPRSTGTWMRSGWSEFLITYCRMWSATPQKANSSV